MKGHIRERSPGKWAIVLDVGEIAPKTGKKKRKWHSFSGTNRPRPCRRSRPRTVHHYRRVLIKALGQAVTWERLSRNPARATTPPKVERQKMLAYNVGQTATLLETLRPTRMFIPVLLAVTCGLRRGEILALRWRHLELGDNLRQMSIEESAEQTNDGVRYKEPKSGRARIVALSASTVAELKAHRTR